LASPRLGGDRPSSHLPPFVVSAAKEWLYQDVEAEEDDDDEEADEPTASEGTAAEDLAHSAGRGGQNDADAPTPATPVGTQRCFEGRRLR